MIIREIEETDAKQIIAVYQEAFATSPWYEYVKCRNCGINFGIDSTDLDCETCPNCQEQLILEEFWPGDVILSKLAQAQRQAAYKGLVAESNGQVIGFLWGYQITNGDSEFLHDYAPAAFYLSEIAVKKTEVSHGVGYNLMKQLIMLLQEDENIDKLVLRTDYRNYRSVGLFQKVGCQIIQVANQNVTDPNYKERIYFYQNIGGVYNDKNN